MGRYRFDDEVLKNRHKPKTTKKPQKLKEKALTIYKEKNWYKIKLKNVCDLFWSSGTFRSNPAEWPAAWPSKLNDRWSRRKIITTMESGSDERSVTIETFSPLPNWVAVNRPSQSQDMCIGVRVYVCMLICACVCVYWVSPRDKRSLVCLDSGVTCRSAALAWNGRKFKHSRPQPRKHRSLPKDLQWWREVLAFVCIYCSGLQWTVRNFRDFFFWGVLPHHLNNNKIPP